MDEQHTTGSTAEADVEATAGGSPPDGDLAGATASLLASVERTDDVNLLRLALAEGTGRDVAREVLATLSEKLTVVGSTLPEAYDPAGPEVDVLVESDHDADALASALADVGVVDGVVVADVVAGEMAAGERAAEQGAPATGPAEPGGRALSIYRLDDHLVVTDDFGAVVERFQGALQGEGQESVAADVEALDDDVVALAERVESLEAGLADVRGDVESAADEGELASLRYHVEDELPTWVEIQHVFAPAAERVDGEGSHGEMSDVVAEMDGELRRTHALREAGLLGRLRWLVTGTLPADGDGGAAGEDDGS